MDTVHLLKDTLSLYGEAIYQQAASLRTHWDNLYSDIDIHFCDPSIKGEWSTGH